MRWWREKFPAPAAIRITTTELSRLLCALTFTCYFNNAAEQLSNRGRGEGIRIEKCCFYFIIKKFNFRFSFPTVKSKWNFKTFVDGVRSSFNRQLNKSWAPTIYILVADIFWSIVLKFICFRHETNSNSWLVVPIPSCRSQLQLLCTKCVILGRELWNVVIEVASNFELVTANPLGRCRRCVMYCKHDVFFLRELESLPRRQNLWSLIVHW